MGSFVIYILEWALCLSTFLLLYKMCFSGSTFHRFNRLFLLGSVVVSALLPLIHVTTTEQMEPIAEVCRLNTEQFEPLNTELLALSSEFSPLNLQLSTLSSQLSTSQRIFLVLALVYLVYICIQTVGWLKSLVKMLLFLRGKRTYKVGRWIRLVVHHEEYGPFSCMNYIVISHKENGFGRRASMRHELSHIKLLHPLDLVFILLCTLINPVCWLVMKEIKVVHEYEADDEVINHYQIQSRDYQRLLVLRTVGAEAYALACSFNLNIKKRIIMMKKKQSNWWRITWIAVTLPLIGISLMAFSKPKEALREAVDNSVKVIEQPIVEALSAATEEVDAIETPAPAPAPAKEAKADNKLKAGDKISGKVKDKEGPLQNVSIAEIDENGNTVASSVTDENGKFAFKVVNPQHKLRVSYVGYKSASLAIARKVNVTLEPAPVLTNVVVKRKVVEEVKAGDRISGSVKDKEGPLKYVNVVELDENGSIVASSVTDENGNFALKVVNPQHKLRVSYEGYKSASLAIAHKMNVTLEPAAVLMNVVVKRKVVEDVKADDEVKGAKADTEVKD